MNKILFSPVGYSDPIRGKHDGPLLHIIRHYKPKLVFLFLTDEMEKYYDGPVEFGELQRNEPIIDNRYIDALKALEGDLGYLPQIYGIPSKIQKAHDYDIVIEKVKKNLAGVHEKYPNSELLLNVTSGTPQIQNALILQALIGSFPVKAIQVSTPEGRGNRFPGKHEIFNVSEEIENLKDNNSSPCRCNELVLKNYRKQFISEKLKLLTRQYNYSACLELLNGAKEIFDKHKLLISLYKHCNLRTRLKLQQAKEAVEGLNLGFNFFIVDDPELEEIFEYYDVLVLKYKKGELSTFILMITPLITEIYEIFIKQYLPLEELIKKNKKGIREFTRAKIQKNYPRLLAFLDDKCKEKSGRGEFHDSFVNTFVMNLILKKIPDLIDKTQKRLNDEGFYEIRKELCRFRNIEDQCRNKTAHQMLLITEDYLQQHIKMSSDEIVEKLENIMRKLFNGFSYNQSPIYDSINNLIIKNLE